MTHPQRLLIAAAIALTATGCSWLGGGKTSEYKGAAGRTVQPLEVPPELTSPTIDDRYAIPDPKAQTSYSAYTQRNQSLPAAPGTNANTVLPPIEGARLERVGDQRWLVVKGEPAAVWPIVREFWTNDMGYGLVREEPNTGILETEWHEDKTKIPQDIVRRTVGKVVPNIFSTPRRDKFRTRLEKGSEFGTTEIFVSNRQVEEIFADANQDRTIWQSKPADREMEAEMLQKLLVKIGVKQTQAANAAAAAKVASAAPAAGAASTESRTNAVMRNDALVVNDSFDRAWRRVGLALDRVGFTVEDRDRSKGLFFVRYIDPERDIAAQKPQESQGFMDRLKFWKSSPKDDNQPQFRIQVSDAGSATSQVQVQNSQGAADRSSTGRKIISLLFEPLK